MMFAGCYAICCVERVEVFRFGLEFWGLFRMLVFRGTTGIGLCKLSEACGYPFVAETRQ